MGLTWSASVVTQLLGLHPTTGLGTRLLGFSRNYWAFHATTRLFTQLLGFSPDYWAFHPTTGLFTQLLSFPTSYWAFHTTTELFTQLLFFYPTTKFFTRLLCSPTYMLISSQKPPLTWSASVHKMAFQSTLTCPITYMVQLSYTM